MKLLLPILFACLTLILTLPVCSQQDGASVSELQRFKDSGKPETFSDLKPQPVPDEQNAATWLTKAEPGRLAIDIALAVDFDFEAKCDEPFIDKFKTVSANHPNTYPWLFKAMELEHYIPKGHYDSATYAEFDEQHKPDEMRSVARVLMYKAAVDLAEGRVDDSARSALAILKLSSLPNVYYGMRGYLTRVAVRGMGIHCLNAVLQRLNTMDGELAQSVKNELKRLDTLDDFQECFDSERVLGIQIMKDQGVTFAAFRIEGYLKTMRLVQEHADQTMAERPALWDSSEKFGFTGAQLFPAINQVRHAAHRNLTKVRCLRLLMELNTQMQDQPDLNDIDLPKSAMTDPVSGDPLIVRKKENGWLIYGVGLNGIDDGGDIDIDNDYGIAPRSKDE